MLSSIKLDTKEKFRIALSKAFKESGLSQTAFAEKAGITQPYLNAILKGKRKGERKMVDIALKLGISISEFIQEPEILEAKKLIEIPIYDVMAGEPSSFTEEGYPIGHAKETEMITKEGIDENTFGIKIHGEDMSPYLGEGDIAIVVPSAPLIKGKLCFATWPGENGRRLVKRYYQYGDTIVLKSDNPAFKDVEINVNNRNDVKIYRVKKSIRIRDE